MTPDEWEAALRKAHAASVRAMATHWSDSMAHGRALCGVLFAPSVKRSPHRRDVTCTDCLAVGRMAKEAAGGAS